MIKLYQYKPRWGVPNASPFCMKLETYLRMAELPYEVTYDDDPRKAPKGKLPYIEDDGKVIADSGLIIEYLKEKYGDKTDHALSDEQKANSLAIQRLIEENLYWVNTYSRWIDPENWETVKKGFFSSMPALHRLFVPGLLRKNVLKQLEGHGLGKHTKDEIYQIGKRDLTALSALLGEKPFFMGEAPTGIDAVAFGSFANTLIDVVNSPLKEHLLTLKNLTDFCDRMKQRYYP